MKDKITILKLGGSVITIKGKALTPNMDAIHRLAKEIAESRVLPLVIIHGGGSYGHPLAAKYKISEGFKSDNQLVGFSKTHNAMASLNTIIVESLMEQGIPVVTLVPSSFIVTEMGRIRDLYKGPLMCAIKMGFVPVLYGDSVLDYEQGFAILSGDQLSSVLAIELNAERIIVGVDVDGLYTSDPKVNPSARLITSISLDELQKFTGGIGGSRNVDVTGGMMGKIFELMKSVMNGVNVTIVNALKPGNIYKALKGEEVIGTRIFKA